MAVLMSCYAWPGGVGWGMLPLHGTSSWLCWCLATLGLGGWGGACYRYHGTSSWLCWCLATLGLGWGSGGACYRYHGTSSWLCVDVLLRLGCGGGVGHVTVTMELLHGCVDVLLRLAWGVGWGMLPLPWNFFMAVLMSCYAWPGGVGWGMLHVAMELLHGCVDVLLRLGWGGGVGHVTVTMELLHGCVDVLLRLGMTGWGGACYRAPWNFHMASVACLATLGLDEVGHVTVTMELLHGCVACLAWRITVTMAHMGGVGWGGAWYRHAPPQPHTVTHGNMVTVAPWLCVMSCYAWAWGGWGGNGMVPVPWNFFMAVLMSCYAWAGGVGWSMLHVTMTKFFMVTCNMSCYACAHTPRVGHVTVTMELLHGHDDVLLRLGGGVGWGMLPLLWDFFMAVLLRLGWGWDGAYYRCHGTSPKPNQFLKELAKLLGDANKWVRINSNFRRRHFWPRSMPFVIPQKAWKFTRLPVTLFPSS